MLNTLLNSIDKGLLPVVIKLLIILLPIFIPIMLIVMFWILRWRWVTLRFIERQTPCLLEIKLPKEILKSPAGMEIFFNYLAQSGASSYVEAFIDGETRPWFSCEIVSIAGDIKFFVWSSQNKFKNMIETELYGHYPGIEIYEVQEKDDYTRMVDFDMEKYKMVGMQYKFAKPDPYPIKTYIDYGLDKDPKDEYKIDPLASVLEFLGSLKAGEYAWMQILVQKHEKEDWIHGVLKREARDIQKEHEVEIEKVRKAAIPKPEKGEDETKIFKFPNPTKGQVDVIAALERSASKIPLDCMIRSMYIAEKDVYKKANFGGLLVCLRQYGSNALNAFKKDFVSDVSDERKDVARILPFFKKFNETKALEYRRDIFHAYKLRSFFQHPYRHYHHHKPLILNTEELATIFHFPSGIVSQTPTLKRVPSKKSEAPSNLPI